MQAARSNALTSLCALGLAVALTGLPALAAPPLADTSVDALISALSGGGATTRSFKRTALPDVGSSLCGGQGAPGGGGGAAVAAANPAAPTGTSRNLEVVPYAGDTTPGVNLSVQFAHASDRLTPADQALLDKLATALKSPTLAQDRFAVAGHTDSTGDAKINLELSCARALAVRRYLSTKGVAAPRLTAYGFGNTRLLEADQPNAGINRRVEVRKAPE